MVDESVLKVILAIAQQAGATAIAVIVVGWILIRAFVDKHDKKMKDAEETRENKTRVVEEARAAKLLEYERKRDDQFRNVDNAIKTITIELNRSLGELGHNINSIGQRVANIEGRLHGSIKIIERE
jgi:hypothetical protein